MANFETRGDYMLRLKGDDVEFWHGDIVVVHVLPAGTKVAASWEFNKNLDKEGWTEENPGTRIREWPNPDWPATSHPVKLVTGGRFVLAIDSSPDAQLLSPDRLNVNLAGRERVAIRFQNHTPVTQMRLRFTTETDGEWNDAKSMLFAVEPNDLSDRTYWIDLPPVQSGKGVLRQLRLDLASGKPLTGTCRFDSILLVR
jgi:hypothetical protein